MLTNDIISAHFMSLHVTSSCIRRSEMADNSSGVVTEMAQWEQWAKDEECKSG